MAMTGVCEHRNTHAATDADWRMALTGNLCRCTGYTSIIAAAIQADATSARENWIALSARTNAWRYSRFAK